MRINSFFLGVLICNIIFVITYLNLTIHYPSSTNNFFIFVNLVFIGMCGIIINCFNAFPKDKKSEVKE